MSAVSSSSDFDHGLERYSREWYAMMVRIWRDRLQAMHVRDTGALLASVEGAGLQLQSGTMQADFRFLDYGLAVDSGTGRYYDSAHRDSRGRLSFLDPTERHARGLRSAPRRPRPWFSISWSISRRVLAERYALAFGEGFAGLFDNLEP